MEHAGAHDRADLSLQLRVVLDELAEAELALGTLRGDLAAFEQRFLRVVATPQARLARLEAELAGRRATHEGTPAAAEEATTASRKADEAEADANRTVPDVPPTEPDESLRLLYRRVARLVHPDLALDDADRTRRNNLMAATNACYAARDRAGLEDLLASAGEAERRASLAAGPAKTDQLRQQLVAGRTRLDAVHAQIAALRASALGRRFDQSAVADSQGRSLLDELASAVEARIENVSSKLAAL